MIFLTAVLFSAVRFGTRAAVLASLASFAAYNFFFIEPIYTFTVAQPQELFALLIFLAVAVLTGSLTGRIRDQRETVIRNAEVTQSLYDYSRKLSGASSADDVLWAAAAHLHATFGGRIVLLVAEGDELQIRAAWPPDAQLDAAALGAAHWAQQKKEPAGWGTGTLPRVAYQFRPLVAARGPIAVCGFEPHSADEPITAEDERALTAILDLTAIALDRALLAREAVNAATMQENEKVRDALLDSLSHDLRTPLSSIAGAATSLRALGDKMSPAERLELLSSIEEETARLARFVANLLDMSRIEAGGLKVNRDLVSIADVVQGAVERSRKAFPGQPVRVSLAPNLPFVRGDDKLLEQVLFNLLDNAHKYAGDAGAIVHARQEGARGRAQRHRRGSRDQAGGTRTHLREVLSRRARRRAQGGHRPWPVDLAAAWSKRWAARSSRRARRCAGAALELSCAFPPPRRRRPRRDRPHERARAFWWSTTSRRFSGFSPSRSAPPAFRCKRRRPAPRLCGWRRPARPISSCSTSACPIGTARTSCATSASSRRRR